MKSSQKRGFSTLAVIGCCLAGYVVLAFAFKSFVGPTAAKYHPVVEAPPAPVAVVAPQPTAAPPAAAAKSAATQSPIMQSPTAQFDLPSRFVVQRPPAPVPEPRAAKPKASTA